MAYRPFATQRLKPARALSMSSPAVKPTGPQPLLRVCTALLQAEVNIIQTYPLLLRPHGRPVVALMVDNIEFAQETLAAKEFTMITENDLQEEE